MINLKRKIHQDFISHKNTFAITLQIQPAVTIAFY